MYTVLIMRSEKYWELGPKPYEIYIGDNPTAYVKALNKNATKYKYSVKRIRCVRDK